jgi:hypothetical protein
MPIKHDTLDLTFYTVEHPEDKHLCIKSAMAVNGENLPCFFSMPNFLYLLEYSGRYDFFHSNTDGKAYYSDVITDNEDFWIWSTDFDGDNGQHDVTVWNFEWKIVFDALKNAQNSLKNILAQHIDIDFLTGGSLNEIIDFKYSMPKKMWLDYLDESLAKEIGNCKTVAWQVKDDTIARIEQLVLAGAHIYQEDKKGNNVLSIILEQPNKKLKELICNIANYPLIKPDTSTVTICRHGIDKIYCAPKGMSLREAQERGLLLEKY